MARALLLQLSDIHIVSETDSVLSRAGHIAAAVQALEPNLDAAILLITGDLAYSGTDDQYLALLPFIQKLTEELANRLNHREYGKSVPVYTAAIPGNHDLNHTNSTVVRTSLLATLLQSPAVAEDPTVINACVELQEACFEAISLIENPRAEPSGDAHERLTYKYKIPICNHRVDVVAFNTAWMSQKSEQQGSLIFPSSKVADRDPDASLTIALLHHPYNWLRADDYRAFKRRVEALADIILTGHEHEGDSFSQTRKQGQTTLYIEAGALQQTRDPRQSQFNAIVVDLERRRQKLAVFSWDGAAYQLPERPDANGDALGLEWEDYQAERLRAGSNIEVAHSTAVWLKSMETPIPYGPRLLRLNDLYVNPDLQELEYPEVRDGKHIPGADFTQLLDKTKRFLVLGEEQSGKTCLGKKIFEHYSKTGLVPVMLTGLTRPPSDERLTEVIVRAFQSQYEATRTQAFLQLQPASRVLIVDDYHKIDLSSDRRLAFLQELTKFADRVVLLANGFIQEARELFDPTGRADAQLQFFKYRILPFSKGRRNDLVERWLALDEDRNTDSVEYAHEREEFVRVLETLTASRRLPKYPLFLIHALSGLDALSTHNDNNIGTRGAVYESLIKKALHEGANADQYSIAHNFLAHLAYRMYEMRQATIDIVTYRAIAAEYQIRFGIPVDSGDMLVRMTRRQLLSRRGEEVSFCHHYLLYFFIAAWMRDYIRREPDRVRAHVRELAKNLHVEANANLLLFLAHLSRDPIILEEVTAAAASTLAQSSAATFDQDVEFLVKSRDTPTTLSLEDGDPDVRRWEIIQKEDEFERRSDLEFDGMVVDPVFGSGDKVSPLGEIVSAVKTIEILGQILKNFPGSLEADEKLEVAIEGYSLGLRLASLIFERMRSNEEMLLKLYVELAREDNPDSTDLMLMRQARDTLVWVSELFGAVIIGLISSSMATRQLELTYSQIEERLPLASVRLINVGIALEVAAAFPEARVLRLARDLANKPYAFSVLQGMVMSHIATMRVPREIRHRVSAALDIGTGQSAAAQLRAISQ